MSRIIKAAIAISYALLTVLTGSFAVQASTAVTYNFDTAGSVAADFNSFISSGTVTQSSTGGINNSGSISVPSHTANAIFVTKPSYSLGPAGSVYNFSAFVKSQGTNGYSGMGFTATALPDGSNADTSGWPFRPNDGLGVSFHGGGFVFSNGTDADLGGNWSSDNTGFTTIKRSSIVDLLGAGSPDDWYKIVFKLTRTTLTTFDARIEVWPSDSTGTLLHPTEADAIFERSGIVNPTLTSAATIFSYTNLSGDRVYNFDDFQVNLAGGSSVVEAGAPVVLTDSTVQTAGVATFDGTVKAQGGSAVTERGFVYDTTSSPIVTDNKVAVGSGVGQYSGTTSTLPNGTYYFRAYATNSTGTTYGSENTVVVADSVASGASSSPTPAAAASSAPTAYSSPTVEALAKTGQNSPGMSLASMVLLMTGISIVVVVSKFFAPIFGFDVRVRYFDYFIKPVELPKAINRRYFD